MSILFFSNVGVNKVVVVVVVEQSRKFQLLLAFKLDDEDE